MVPAQPSHVFISYRRTTRDSEIARSLYDAIKRSGHEVFIDSGMEWGRRWGKLIREALEKCEYLVVLLSQEAAQSEMVTAEVSIGRELATQRGGRPKILPIRVALQSNEALPYEIFAYVNALQAETWNEPADTQRLAERLVLTLNGEESWSGEVIEMLQGPGSNGGHPQPQFDPRSAAKPGGAVDIDAPWYVLRASDHQTLAEVQRHRGLVTLRAPRQTGKTSQALRVITRSRTGDQTPKCAYVDLQVLSRHDLTNLDSLWKAIALRIAKQVVQPGGHQPVKWDDNLSFDANLTEFLETAVFQNDGRPLVLCFDEADRVFSYGVSSDFFGSIRHFFNQGAFDPAWRNVRWLITTSTEPAFFIDDIHQSPFNVGQQLTLESFAEREVRDLASNLGIRIADAEITDLLDYLGGQPYLTHLFLYLQACGEASAKVLFDASTAGGEAFRDHLHRFLVHLRHDDVLASTFSNVLARKRVTDLKALNRLEGAGLIRVYPDGQAEPRCGLYADYFGRELTAW